MSKSEGSRTRSHSPDSDDNTPILWHRDCAKIRPREMLIFFVLIGLPLIAAAVLFVISSVGGSFLCLSRRFRRIGIVVLIVPTLSSAFAVAMGWGAVVGVEAAGWHSTAFVAFPIGKLDVAFSPIEPHGKR